MTDILATTVATAVTGTTTELTLPLALGQADQLETPEKNGIIEVTDPPLSPTSPFVLKPPSTNSKLILQNMEEVLNSVKKKHRQKHKRKKEQRRLAQLAEESGRMELNGDGKPKQPLREKAAQENGLHSHEKKPKSSKPRKSSPLKCSLPVADNVSIMKHFQRTPKKDSQSPTIVVLDESVSVKEAVIVDQQLPGSKTAKPANVFELMMNARNRSIGANVDGHDLPMSPSAVAVDSPTRVKRKLMLQEWADRKGGTKRKMEEEARAAYVEEHLEQRAKRLKKMLTRQGEDSDNKTEATNQKLVKEKSSIKRGKGRTRKKRLTSIDSVDSVELTPTQVTLDSETSEFLGKLSSPTKKRDSLLGYFPKTESPKDLGNDTPKAEEDANAKQNKKGIPVELNTPTSSTTPRRRIRAMTESTSDGVIATPSGRPRRSCVGKARYDYDAEESPTKIVKTVGDKVEKQKNQTKSSTKATMENSIEIIDLDSSSGTLQTPKKLAPLFVRQMPKPSPDPSKLRAREEFLRSGVPEKLKQEQAKQKQFEQHYEDTYEHFPRLSHVLQLSEQELTALNIKQPTTRIKLRAEDDDIFVLPSPAPQRMRKTKSAATSNVGNITNCTPADFQTPWRSECCLNTLPSLDNKRSIIKTWKNDFERFPTYKCYNQMCEKYRYFRAIDTTQDVQQVNESFVVTRSSRRSFEPSASEDEKPPPTALNGELLFTEKYKPLLFEQVLVGLTPVQQLRDFLANWCTSSVGNNSPSGSQRNSQTFDESFDFANDSNSSSAVSNTMVLLGPTSSGKTNAVYALANDMNFNVLEINAGMRRTGKKLMQELLEATQSHQIRKDTKSSQSKHLLKMSLNGLKSKQKNKKAKASEMDISNDASQSVRKSLILIEDADILFEQTDAGFTDAIYTLAASSKRPVIVVASDPNCSHLQRLMQQNTIHFQAPHVLSICKFLSVLALIENCPILLDDLVSLYSYNNRNLRKTLLELQFFIQTGGDCRKPPELPVTPQKSSNKQPPTDGNAVSPYYASPSKSKLIEDPNTEVEQDDQLTRGKDVASRKTDNAVLYMHNKLFEFYTCAQNEKFRIPFPVDFQLLRVNLKDMMRVSDKLQPSAMPPERQMPNKGVKRKSRSPKKAWLNSATNEATASTNSPMKALCAFYENISVAALLGSCDSQNCTDRLLPHLSEHIAHSLVEQSLKVNLSARACPYNLFDTANECLTITDQLGTYQMRTQRVRALDYEPMLRAICRSEKQRATEERRSSRFYHYLRNCTVNSVSSFSTEIFDAVCTVFQEDTTTTETGTTATETTMDT